LLQFEVLTHRLEHEYGAESRLDSAPWTITKWIRRKNQQPWTRTTLDPDDLPYRPDGSRLVIDDRDRVAMLFADEWALRFFRDRNEDVELSDRPF